jgi:CRP/FNR family transcriptional regulator, cyclic AMP receptor protein
MLTNRTSHDEYADIDLFKGCTRSERDRVSTLTTGLFVREGRALCRQGSIGSEAFVIVEGEASVEIDGARVATLGPSDVFGEMALLDGGPRIATVRALTPTKVLVLNRSEFSSMLAVAPDVAKRILEAVSRRLREADSRDLAVSA